MYVHSVYQLVASSFRFIFMSMSVCWVRRKSLRHHKMHILPSRKTSVALVPPINTKERLSWQAVQCICLTLAFWSFVKADLVGRDKKWNPMFGFLLYEFWNNKFSFVQIDWIINVNCRCQKIWGVYKLIARVYENSVVASCAWSHHIQFIDSSPSNAYFAKLILESCTYSLSLCFGFKPPDISISNFPATNHEQFNFGNLMYAVKKCLIMSGQCESSESLHTCTVNSPR